MQSDATHWTRRRVHTEYTSWSVHNTVFPVNTWLRTPWLKIKLSQVQKSSSLIVFHSHPAPQCLCWTSRIVRSLVCCPHLWLRPQDPLRLPPQLQDVGATAQARPLAGVSLAEWLTQPQTQVMSSSSPTSSTTRIRSTRRSTFLTATTTPTSPEGLPNSEAFSSSWKAAAGRVSSLFGHPSPKKLSAGHVSGRPGLQETGAELDRESVAPTLFSSQSKRKRDRETNVVHSFRDRKSPKDLWTESWLGQPRWERERLSKHCTKLRLGLRREIGKGEILILLFRRSVKNLNLNDFSCIKQVDGQIRLRDKISWYGELELRTRLFRENHARDCQEIEELRRICCEETDQGRQARSEELSLQHQWESFDCESDDGQLWSDPRSWSNFYDSEFQDFATLRFWIAAKDIALYWYYGTRFWTTTCSRRITLSLPQIQKIGIFISGFKTWYFRDSKERNEKGIIECADSITSLPKYQHRESESGAEDWQWRRVQNSACLYGGISRIYETASRIFAVQNTWRSHCWKRIYFYDISQFGA